MSTNSCTKDTNGSGYTIIKKEHIHALFFYYT